MAASVHIRRILLVCLAATIADLSPAHAQVDALRTIGPAPTVAALARFEDVPVGLYTGTPQVALPLYTVEGYALRLALTLHHHGGAVKPAELAGWTGLGWSLRAGGVITRSVRGLPDERCLSLDGACRGGYVHTEARLRDAYGAGGLPASILNNPTYPVDPFAGVGDPDAAAAVREGVLDPEPDRFFFDVAGRSGRFILGPTSVAGDASRAEVVPIPRQDVRIELTRGAVPGVPDETITEWILTMEDGTRYVFGDVELSAYTAIDLATGQPLGTPSAATTTSWHLSRIESAAGDDVITFTYDAHAVTHLDPAYEKDVQLLEGTVPECVQGTARVLTGTRIDYTAQVLRSIRSAFGVVFFDTSLRQDARQPFSGVQQARKLDRIRVLTPSEQGTLRTFTFAYSYFDGHATDGSAPQTYHDDGRRLRLDAVQEHGGSGTPRPPTVFAYHEGELASRFTRAIDHWGYFNGRTHNTTLVPSLAVAVDGVRHFFSGADRSPGPAAALLPGTLRRVTYPTGGYAAFDYEPHDFGYEAFEEVATANPVPAGTSLLVTDDGLSRTAPLVEATTLSFGRIGQVDDPVAVTLRITALVPDLSAGGGSTQCAPDGPCLTVRITDGAEEVARWTSPGMPAGATYEPPALWLSPDRTYTLEVELGFLPNPTTGRCTQDGSPAGAACQATVSASWREEPVGAARTGGGLRVRRIVEHDGVDPANDIIRRFSYRRSAEPDRSSGVLLAAPRYHFVDPPLPSEGIACRFITRAGQSFVPLGSNPGSAVGYEEVTVSYGAQGEFGASVYTFTSSRQDAAQNARHRPPWQTDGGPPFGVQALRAWKYGLPTGERHRNTGAITQELRLTAYRLEDDSSEPPRFRRFLGLLAVPTATITVPSLTGPDQVVSFTWYGWYERTSAFPHPAEVTVRTFDASGTLATTATRRYGHAAADHLQRTRLEEVNADGRTRVTTYTYAHETHRPAMGPDGAHMLSQPYSTTIRDGTSNVERKTWTTWRLRNGSWLPDAAFAWRGDGSPDDLDAPAAPGSCAAPHAEVDCVAEYVAYDARGRLTHANDARGVGTVLSYDALDGRALSRVEKAGLSVSYAYHDGNDPTWGLLQAVRDENGDAVRYAYDDLRRLVAVTNAQGKVVTAYAYHDTSGDVVHDPSSVTTTTYGNESTGRVTTAYFDGLGRPTLNRLDEGDGHYVLRLTEYDARGRLARAWKPYRDAGENGFDPAKAGQYYGPHPYVHTRYLPDPLNRIDTVVAEGGEGTVTARHGVEAVDGTPVAYAETTDEEGRTTGVFTDAFGNVVRRVIGAGSDEEAVTTLEYDILGNLVAVRPPAYHCRASQPHCDTPGHTGWISTYTYDPRGRLVAAQTPDADGAFSYSYDAADHLRYTIDPRRRLDGGYLYTDYDDLGRVVETGRCRQGISPVQTAGPTPCASTDRAERVHYRYDAYANVDAQLAGRVDATNPKGHLVRASFDGGSYQYFYDDDGRITGLYVVLDDLGAGKLVEYAYDRQDRVEKVSYQSGKPGEQLFAWYRYDPAGRLERLLTSRMDDIGTATQEAHYVAYAPTGRVEHLQLGPDPSALPGIDYSYNVRDWLTAINDPDGDPGAEPFALKLAYRNNGSVAAATWATRGNALPAPRVRYRYAHDALNRLVSADFDVHDGTAWVASPAYDVGVRDPVGYDANGNVAVLRRNDALGQGSASAFAYRAGSNRLLAVSGGLNVALAYDANGNVTHGRAGSDITFDRRNLPTSLTIGATGIMFGYDAHGRRITKRLTAGDGVTTTTYVRGLDGRVLAVYVNEHDGPALAYWNILSPADRAVLGRIEPPPYAHP